MFWSRAGVCEDRSLVMIDSVVTVSYRRRDSRHTAPQITTLVLIECCFSLFGILLMLRCRHCPFRCRWLVVFFSVVLSVSLETQSRFSLWWRAAEVQKDRLLCKAARRTVHGVQKSGKLFFSILYIGLKNEGEFQIVLIFGLCLFCFK